MINMIYRERRNCLNIERGTFSISLNLYLLSNLPLIYSPSIGNQPPPSLYLYYKETITMEEYQIMVLIIERANNHYSLFNYQKPITINNLIVIITMIITDRAMMAIRERLMIKKTSN